MSMAIDGNAWHPAVLIGPHHRAVSAATTHRAVRRDLDRFAIVLADPVTTVRRAALVEHIGFVLDQLDGLHRLLDESLWPAVLEHRPHLTDLADRAAEAHTGLTEPIAALRQAAATWKRAPITRTAAHTAVRNLTLALEPIVGQDAETVPLACAMLPPQAWAEIEHSQPRSVGPTKVARRLFWLLDDLPPAQAAALLAPTRSWTLWVLRNGFSGAYNRAAYLMWIGGGNGPAV
ncbi:MAG: hypothetical protein ABJD68_04775 [Nakamurella sp.]